MSKDQEGGLDQLLVPIYVDPDGNAVGVEDVFTKLEAGASTTRRSGSAPTTLTASSADLLPNASERPVE